MIGADEIIKLRSEGKKPFWVNIWVGEVRDDMAHEWHKWIESLDNPVVDIDVKENLEALDFRFAHRMLVLIRGDNPDKLLKVYEKITAVQPERVLMFYGDKSIDILDSKGLLSGIIE